MSEFLEDPYKATLGVLPTSVKIQPYQTTKEKYEKATLEQGVGNITYYTM